MKVVCEILADSTDGVSASIKINVFKDIYCYLTERNADVNPSDTDAVLDYMEKVAERQDGTVNPANFRAPDCPKL